MAGNRERSLSAAVELIGDHGIRALTHLRVDERAGLPRGSTSNVFRSRAALLKGVIDEVLEAERPSIQPVLAASTPHDLVRALATTVDVLVGPRRTATAARLALFAEAAHDPVIAESCRGAHARMNEWMVPVFQRLGADDPSAAARTVYAAIDGALLHRLIGERVDAERVLGDVMAGIFRTP